MVRLVRHLPSRGDGLLNSLGLREMTRTSRAVTAGWDAIVVNINAGCITVRAFTMMRFAGV